MEGIILKKHVKISLIFILIALIASTGCVQAEEKNIPTGDTIDLGNGLFLVYMENAGRIDRFQSVMYFGEKVSTLIQQHSDMELVYQSPHIIGYGYTDGYYVFFRPKNPCNCTC